MDRSPSGWGQRARDYGCFLPFVLAPAGLVLGWWLGLWWGIGAAAVGGFVGLWLFERWNNSHAVTELAPAVAIYLILLGLIAGAVPKVRQAADRIRAEREARQKGVAEPVNGEQK